MIKGTWSYLAGLEWVCVSLLCPWIFSKTRSGPVPAAGGASPLPRPPYDALGGQRLQGSVFHRTALGEIDRPHKTLNSLGFKMTTNHPITGIAGKTCWSISENLKCGFLSAKPFELCLLRSERQGLQVWALKPQTASSWEGVGYQKHILKSIVWKEKSISYRNNAAMIFKFPCDLLRSLFNLEWGLTHITWALGHREKKVGVFPFFLAGNGIGLSYNFEIQANPWKFSLWTSLPCVHPSGNQSLYVP